MKFVALLIFGALPALPLAAMPAGAYLFSRSLNPAERTECGLDRLSPQQIASLDQLVRRESAMMAASSRAKPFSKGLEPAERHSAGLDRLTPTQITRLDTLVSAWSLADAALSYESDAAPPEPAGANTEIARDKPQIHGSITLGFGAGSGGYSERTGALDMYYVDPAHRFSINFGYSDSQVKYGDANGCAPGYFNPAR